MAYPQTRPRRLRTSAAMRKMVCQTRLHPADFMYPLFVCPGTNIKDPIVAFAFGNKGLMADLSLAGSKYTKIVPDK